MNFTRPDSWNALNTNLDRVAILQDTLVQMGGAERVVQALARALPGAALYTALAAPWRLVPELGAMNIRTTWMRHLPAPDRFYRHYFLLYPFAVETLNLQEYDLIVSSCCGYSKGVKKRPDAVHVCYCHTPMRWAWRYDDYVSRERLSGLRARILPWLVKPLRRWDLRASKQPDYFIANSAAVAARIRKCYNRDAVIIPPPIDLRKFHTSATQGDFYLVISRLVSYKRIELAIQACNLLGRRLIIIGDGPDRSRLEGLAGPSIKFLGRQPDSVLSDVASECRALLFPGEEDFGLVPLEVNASGRPVVAWRGGGALETVLEHRTGIFFDEATPESLAAAMTELESREWDPITLRAHAAKYDVTIFVKRLQAFLQSVLPASRPDKPLLNPSTVDVVKIA